MPNMQDANNLLCLVHFVENPIDVLAFSEDKTSDFPACFLCFTSNGTTVRKFLQGVQTIDELREPLRPSDWRALKYPIIDLVRLGLRRISEDDLVGHVSRGTLFQTASGASRDQLLRLQGRA